MTCDNAINRVRSVTHARIGSSTSSCARVVTSATRTVAPVACSGASRPGCSEFVVTTSSPSARPKPLRTMLHPSVVELVSATRSAGAPISAASASRTRERRVNTLSNHVFPPRPCSWSNRFRASIASMVARDIGPSVPAFRYANRSSTGNCARASSTVIRRSVRRARDPRGRARRRVCAPPASASSRRRTGRGRGCGRFRCPLPRTPIRASRAGEGPKSCAA